MSARLILIAAVLVAGCAAHEPLHPGPRETGTLTSEGYWLARADEAEVRGDPAAALHALERWASEHPERIDRAFEERRLRLASAADDETALAAASAALLEFARGLNEHERFALAEVVELHAGPHAAATAFAYEYQDPVLRLRALRRRAAALEQAGEWEAAAESLERAAADPGAAASARGWWEHASWLWERAGDRARAVRAIEYALQGVELGPREEAALARLRAFELGEIDSIEDARATLRFHADAERRLTAARFLATRRFPDEISVFGHALADPDGRVVAVALAQIAERFATAERAYAASCARRLTADPREEVRLAALALLGASGADADVPALLAALDPEHRAQFRVARRALESLTGRAEPAPLEPDLVGREELRAAWASWWKARTGPG